MSFEQTLISGLDLTRGALFVEIPGARQHVFGEMSKILQFSKLYPPSIKYVLIKRKQPKISNRNVILGQKLWFNVMRVLDEQDGIDSELLVFAMTLINKTLYGVPDQDLFYDVTDAIEMQNMEGIQKRYRGKGADKKEHGV